MVDSINSNVPTVLRAQSAGITALKSNNQATQAIINELQKTALPAKTSGVAQTAKLVGTTSNLPRGSLVDVLV